MKTVDKKKNVKATREERYMTYRERKRRPSDFSLNRKQSKRHRTLFLKCWGKTVNLKLHVQATLGHAEFKLREMQSFSYKLKLRESNLAEPLQKKIEKVILQQNKNNTREKSGLHKGQESTRNDNYVDTL